MHLIENKIVVSEQYFITLRYQFDGQVLVLVSANTSMKVLSIGIEMKSVVSPSTTPSLESKSLS